MLRATVQNRGKHMFINPLYQYLAMLPQEVVNNLAWYNNIMILLRFCFNTWALMVYSFISKWVVTRFLCR